MNVQDQLTEFSRRLSCWGELSGSFKERRATGASNTPFPIKGGMRIGIWNIENTDFLGLRRSGDALVLVSPVTLPPGDYTLCFALAFHGPVIDQIGRRRDEIRVELDKRPNNVGFFLHREGVVLSPLTDLSDISAIDPAMPEFGSPIPVTANCYSDVLRAESLCPCAESYVQFIRGLLRPTPLTRL